jgi:hypothetical protein
MRYERLLQIIQSDPKVTAVEALHRAVYWPANLPMGTPHVVAATASMTLRAASLGKVFVLSRISAAAAWAKRWRNVSSLLASSVTNARKTADTPSNCGASSVSSDGIVNSP